MQLLIRILWFVDRDVKWYFSLEQVIFFIDLLQHTHFNICI